MHGDALHLPCQEDVRLLRGRNVPAPGVAVLHTAHGLHTQRPLPV